ncbi:unnamed protein product, partial [Bathycoccus prasinos]
PINVVISYDP